MRPRRHVALLLFPEVEVLDFAGPFEVFAVTDELSEQRAFAVHTVAPTTGPLRARNGLRVVPDYTLADCPAADVLIVPGGYGTRALLRSPEVLHWIQRQAATAEVVLSVCTGALLLAAAGLTTGCRVTTHHECLDLLRQLAPQAHVDPTRRFHDNPAQPGRPRLVVAAGISAGLEAALHVVAALQGAAAAQRTARYMEYEPRGAETVGGVVA